MRWKHKLQDIKWDPWLVRASHVATVLGVVVAVLTLVFVVVPLYKVAALEKQIFDLEQERDRLKTELATSYVSLRNRIVSMAVWRAGPPCTGMLEPSKVPESAKLLADAIRGMPVEPQDESPSWERTLSADVRGCILKEVGDLPQLKPQDKAIFMSEVRAAADRIAADQQESLKRARELPAQARKDPSVLPPPDDHETIQRYFDRHLPDSEIEARALERRIANAQFYIEVDWAKRTRDALLALSKVRWPE